jgi:DNA modification methylase
MAQHRIFSGHCLHVLRSLRDESFHSIVTDPPYELGFMGKDWDNAQIAFNPRVWQHCYRVLKPGGYLLAFGGTRTFHRIAVAIEDAGFEIRDSIAWIYSTGFPKSADVSKQLDKMAGVEFSEQPASGVGFMRPDGRNGYNVTKNQLTRAGESTDAAKKWQGWGTALKPAFEPIIVARKPFKGTVAANVLEHGTGALNIDACRVEATPEDVAVQRKRTGGAMGVSDGRTIYAEASKQREPTTATGRWPTNVVLDGEMATELDEQSGTTTSRAAERGELADMRGNNYNSDDRKRIAESSTVRGYSDSGGASRFFPVIHGEDDDESLLDSVVFKYQAKAPAKERPKVDGVSHPTVKPLELMRWLTKLVTPPRGRILDPFAGSGTTVEAAILEGFRPTAIELCDGANGKPDYVAMIEKRAARAYRKVADGSAEK